MLSLFNNKIEYDINQTRESAAQKLLIFTEHVNATYYINFHYPLANIQTDRPISFRVLSQASVRKQKTRNITGFVRKILKTYKPDLVIFTRYSLPSGVDIMGAFKNEGIPAIYHIDDNLLEIPDLLGDEIRKRQGAKEALQERAEQIKQADIVYVSTAELASTLEHKLGKLNFFQGMSTPYLECLLDKRVRKNKSAGITIGYMGSKGHKYDLEMIAPALDKVLAENPDVSFEVFGSISMPTLLLKHGDRVRSHSYKQDYADFLQQLYILNWDIGLAPLQDHKFNMCKTPIKYLEYTACDIPTIASNVPVYSRDINEHTGFLCGDDEWYAVIMEALCARDDLSAIQQNAKRYCEEEYSLKKLESQLNDLFQQLFGRRSGQNINTAL